MPDASKIKRNRCLFSSSTLHVSMYTAWSHLANVVSDAVLVLCFLFEASVELCPCVTHNVGFCKAAWHLHNGLKALCTLTDMHLVFAGSQAGPASQRATAALGIH